MKGMWVFIVLFFFQLFYRFEVFLNKKLGKKVVNTFSQQFRFKKFILG